VTAPEDFDWDDVADDVVQRAVEKVAIFSNPNGDVVIRQERMWNEEDDPFIIIARGNALRAAQAILEAAGMGDIQFHRAVRRGYVDVDVPGVDDGDAMAEREEKPKPEPLSNAERQRRFKEKRRAETAAGNGGNEVGNETGNGDGITWPDGDELTLGAANG